MKNLKFLLLTLLSLVILSCSTNEIPKQKNAVSYKISMSAGITTDNCYVLSTPYHVRAEFISDNNIKQSYTYTGSNPTQVYDSFVVSGNLIAIKLKLTDFNSTNQYSGKGLAVQYVSINISNNETGEILLSKKNTETFQLYICTNTIYEATLLYDTQNNTYSIVKKDWNF